MQTIATQLRGLQFLAHQSHNLCKGPNFFADHAYLGELYDAYEEAYDKVIETSIALGKPLDPTAVTAKAAGYIDPFKDTDSAFKSLLNAEADLRDFIKEEYEGQEIGVQNLLAQLAQDSTDRTYKIQQRLA